MTAIPLIAEALTAEEARTVTRRFLDALDYFDRTQDRTGLVRELQAAADQALAFAGVLE